MQRRRLLPTFLATLVLLSVLAAPALAQDGSAEWDVDTILKQSTMTDVDIDPEGERILWVKRTPDEDKDRYVTDLQLTYLDDPHGGEEPATLRLTHSGDNSSPAWSPDGQRIAFISSREKEDADTQGRQIWLMDPRGGEPERLTSLENGVQRFEWLDDGRLIVSGRERKTQHERALEERKDGSRVVEDTTAFYPARLFAVDVSTQKTERLSDNNYQVQEFAASPDGRHVVYAEQQHPVTADARNLPRQYVLDLETGERTELDFAPHFNARGFTWSLGGEGFYAGASYASDPENAGAGIQELFFVDVETLEQEQVPLKWENGIGQGSYAVAEGGIHVQLADGPKMNARFYAREGDSWSHRPVEDERFHHSTSIEIGPDGETVVFETSRATTPPEYLAGRYDRGRTADVQEFTTINEQLEQLPMPESEVITWEGAEGTEVNGILYYPLDYDPERSYPLVTLIHGGPSGVDLDVWSLSWTVYPEIWAQRGAFVLRPNYQGSGHHGLDYVEAIKGRYYELELPDIVNGIDHLAEEGKVDRDSLGVIGWSNGAILAIGLTVEYPEMFQVAAPGAGNVNWISDYGNCAFGVRFDDSYFQGAPWEELDHYIEKSMFFRLEEVVTPTLIHFGTEDRAVPTEQGWQHYRALQQMDNAPVRFLLYPDEEHGLTQLSHQRRKMEEDLAWFDTYLFGTTSMEERVADRLVAEDAPLARLERQQEIARSGGLYGVETDGHLVPETVALGDTLEVGRFEVTRAQFAAFQDAYDVSPGTENHPANRISFDEAEAYAEWLSEVTGETYRLPTKEEFEALRSSAGSSENNLHYWIGYEPTPDEHAAIDARMRRQEADELLMPVGSRPPGNAEDNDQPLLFDLDGNVAEWAGADDGSGTIATSSAVTHHDALAQDPADMPPEGFTGLRVVKEQ